MFCIAWCQSKCLETKNKKINADTCKLGTIQIRGENLQLLYYFLLLVIDFSNTDNIWHVDALIKLFRRGSLKDDFVEFISKSLFTRKYISKQGQFHLFSVRGPDHSLILAWRKTTFDHSLIQMVNFAVILTNRQNDRHINEFGIVPP